MTWPFHLPDWLPWWVPLAALVPVLLYVVLFLAMPFSVFGLKGRLDQLEQRLDEIQGEIRRLGSRPSETIRYAGSEAPPQFGRGTVPGRAPRRDEPLVEDRVPLAPDTPTLRAEPLAPPRRRPPEDDAPRRVEPASASVVSGCASAAT